VITEPVNPPSSTENFSLIVKTGCAIEFNVKSRTLQNAMIIDREADLFCSFIIYIKIMNYLAVPAFTASCF
jgi:hypothetical protein